MPVIGMPVDTNESCIPTLSVTWMHASAHIVQPDNTILKPFLKTAWEKNKGSRSTSNVVIIII